MRAEYSYGVHGGLDPAALGIPWLPQTFLVPVARSGFHPDEPCQNVRWAEEPACVFLQANPDIQLHHMHDPNQDRLMLQRMTYFRVKKLWLRSEEHTSELQSQSNLVCR